MIKQLSILDIPEILTFVGRFYHDTKALPLFITCLLRGGGYILTPPEDKGMMILTEALGVTRARGHIYIAEEYRGKQALRFTLECYKWGWENTAVTEVLNKVPINDHKLRMFMGMIGNEEIHRDSLEITYIRRKLEDS